MRLKPSSGLLAVLFLAAAAFFSYRLFFVPFQNRETSQIVEVPFGASTQEAAKMLHEKGWIPWAPGWVVLSRLTGARGQVRAGEYLLQSGMSPWQILELLRRGKVVLHRVTIPEGLRAEDAAHIAAEQLSLSGDRFLALVTDREFVRSLGLDVPSLEGYLLPETYSFPKGVTEEKVVQKMVEEMLSFFNEERRSRAASLGMSLHQVLTLASVIEKEVRVESEGPLISSVYHNRLRKKMRLQSDPTVIYGIANFDGNLRRRDLRKDTPYNTYLRSGLPPTPIANPGKASILAALYPEETGYLYFVSRNDGTHAFSETLAAHNREVDRYQRRR